MISSYKKTGSINVKSLYKFPVKKNITNLDRLRSVSTKKSDFSYYLKRYYSLNYRSSAGSLNIKNSKLRQLLNPPNKHNDSLSKWISKYKEGKKLSEISTPILPKIKVSIKYKPKP